MNRLIILLLTIISIADSNGQCNFLGSSISVSRDTLVQMYSPAFFLIQPNTANEIFWELSDFDGNLLDDSTTTESLAILTFDTPLTDSMQICQTVINSVTDSICQVCDTLIYSGEIIHWEILSPNVGMITSTSTLDELQIRIFPNPATDYIHIEVPEQIHYTSTIYDLQGNVILSESNNSFFEISRLPLGVYFVEILDVITGQRIVREIIK